MNDKIIQIITAPANLKAIFVNEGKQNNVNVLCLALMEDTDDGSRYVTPMVFTDTQGIVSVEDALEYGDYATTEHF